MHNVDLDDLVLEVEDVVPLLESPVAGAVSERMRT